MIEAREIETELLAFLRREVFGPQVVVTPETDLVAAGFDSMSLVRLLLFVETTYGLWIPAQEITSTALQDLRALAATVSRLLNER
jgi:acyl carrier protein